MTTIRQQIIIHLEDKEMTAKEISQAVSVREKEVYEHLAHIARSVINQKKELITEPPRCLRCGFVFKDRKRLKPPSRCPKCKNEHIQNPSYRVA
jgi:transcriptional regulator